MKKTTLPLLTVAAALLAAGCGSDYDGLGGPQTVTKIAATEIATNTGEDTAPILINDLPISAADTRDDTDPKPIY